MQNTSDVRPLSYYAESVVTRAKALSTYFPELWEVANAVHQGFEVALRCPWPADRPCNEAGGLRWRLGHLAHLDWVYSFTLLTSGQRSMSMMLSRRAVEYLAHAAAVETPERARLYIERADHQKRPFRNAFEIPGAFRNEKKYGFLWNLLGISDLGSSLGGHASWDDGELKHLAERQVGYFDDPRFTPGAAYLGAQLGIWLVEAFEKIMESERPGDESWARQHERIAALMLRARDLYLLQEPLRSQLAPLLAEDPESYGRGKFVEALARADKSDRRRPGQLGEPTRFTSKTT